VTVVARDEPSDARVGLARRVALVARIVFAVLVVVMPFHARIDPLPHPASSVSAVLADLVIYAIDVLAVAVLGLWLLARTLDRRPIRSGPRALVAPVAVIVGLAWLTIPFGIEPALSVAGATRITLGALLAVYVRNEVDGLDSVALPLGLMLGLQSVVALAQAVSGGDVGLGWIGELRLDPAAAGTSVVTLPDGARLLRAYGLSTHPNVLGGFLAGGSLLLLGVRSSTRASLLARRAVIALAAVALVATFSRGAWLGVGLGLGLGLGLLAVRGDRPGTRQWLTASALILAVGLGAGWLARDAVVSRTGLGPTIPETEQRSIDERLAQIGLGWQVFLDRPLTGVGASAAPIAMRDRDPAFPFAFYAPHLVALTVAAELGVAGGVAYVWLLAAPWVLLARRRARITTELAAASAALAALTVGSLVDDYPWVGGPGRTLAWFVLGLWAMAWARSAHGPAAGPGRDRG